MSNIILVTIPEEVVEIFILPFIDNKIKMLLTKKYYLKYHNDYYRFSHKFLIFIVKNKINICVNLLSDYKNFDIYKKEKINYDKKKFFILYDFCIYISKKFSNLYFYNYCNNLQQSDYVNDFSKLRIKQYKNFINKNILWIK